MRTFLLILLTAALVSCSAARYDWPRWRGPNGDNISRERGWNPRALEGGPRIAWQVDVGGGYSNVAIQDNRLYAMGWDVTGVLAVACCCLDASTGKEIWRYSFPSFLFPQATPTVEGSSVYCLCTDGLVHCLDTGNGKLRWKNDLVVDCGAVKPAYGFAGSPVIVGNLLIFTANTSGIALDKRTGVKVWASEAPPKLPNLWSTTGTEYHTPVIYPRKGKPHAVICSWKGVFSVEVKTGKAQLLFDWKDSLQSVEDQVADPLIFREKVFIARYRKSLGSILLDIQDQETKVLWKNEETFSEIGSPAFLDGYLYVCQGGGSSGGWLKCLDAETGTAFWEVNPEEQFSRISLSFTVADGKLIVLNSAGTLSIAEVSPEGYRVISSCDVLVGEKKTRKFWTPPVLCNGLIYCRNLGGDLVCVDVHK